MCSPTTARLASWQGTVNVLDKSFYKSLADAKHPATWPGPTTSLLPCRR
jgi:hypothetical protein